MADIRVRFGVRLDFVTFKNCFTSCFLRVFVRTSSKTATSSSTHFFHRVPTHFTKTILFRLWGIVYYDEIFFLFHCKTSFIKQFRLKFFILSNRQFVTVYVNFFRDENKLYILLFKPDRHARNKKHLLH